MKYLFFDTETTGPNHATARPVQLAWLLASESGETLLERSHLIQPVGFEIPARTTAIHGITTDRAAIAGIPFNDLVYRFNNSVFIADVLIAHNFEYDFNVMKNEMQRQNQLGALSKLYDLDHVCTMSSTINYCRLPNPKGHGFKRPGLSELHFLLFGEHFKNAHDALADVRATARCFFQLKKLHVL